MWLYLIKQPWTLAGHPKADQHIGGQANEDLSQAQTGTKAPQPLQVNPKITDHFEAS